jgi:UDP-GlcNAc:undecaprenyl-phosphate/decaprenyl-phosphate GlcNAc-1-phosphate transferase
MSSSFSFYELMTEAIILFAVMHLYIQWARRKRIIDNPNERSSHKIATIRGGGIVVVVAQIAWWFFYGHDYPYVTAGVLMLACISFLDDFRSVSPLYRFVIHIVAMITIILQLNMGHEYTLIIVVLVMGVGVVNAFNFMDGINGITGLYALVNLSTFLYLNENDIVFTSTNLLIYLIVSVLIFLFFNFRKEALCFAGDVGSVTLAFLQVFFCLQLMIVTQDLIWILFFLLFGTDAVITILYRIRNRENIFKPHRSHVYQFLANELKVLHLQVATLYAVIQLGVNFFTVFHKDEISVFTLILILVTSALLMILIREFILKRLGVSGLFVDRNK